MKIELDLTVSNSALSEASRKFGEQIAKAKGETYDQDKHFSLGFKGLRERMEAAAESAAIKVLDDENKTKVVAILPEQPVIGDF